MRLKTFKSKLLYGDEGFDEGCLRGRRREEVTARLTAGQRRLDLGFLLLYCIAEARFPPTCPTIGPQSVGPKAASHSCQHASAPGTNLKSLMDF